MEQSHKEFFQKINEEIVSLWSITGEDHLNFEVVKMDKRYPMLGRPPLYYDCELLVKDEQILFVGLNPSYSESENNKTLKELNFSKEIFDFSTDHSIIDSLIKFDRYQRRNYGGYFNPIDEVGQLTSRNTNPEKKYNHIDLFLNRERDSKILKEQLLKKEDFKVFFESQIKIVFDIIKYLKPKVIVFNSALASRIVFGELKGDETELNYLREKILTLPDLDNKVGKVENSAHYKFVFKNPSFKSIAVGSGMLSSGVVDNYSKERLIWYIEQIINGDFV